VTSESLNQNPISYGGMQSEFFQARTHLRCSAGRVLQDEEHCDELLESVPLSANETSRPVTPETPTILGGLSLWGVSLSWGSLSWGSLSWGSLSPWGPRAHLRCSAGRVLQDDEHLEELLESVLLCAIASAIYCSGWGFGVRVWG